MPMWMIMLGYKVGSLCLVILTAALAGLALLPAAELFQLIDTQFGMTWAVASVPLLYVVWGVSFCTIIVVFKRMFFLKTRAGEHNLFSFMTGVWAVSGFLVRIADTMFMQHLAATPFMVIWYRALGAKIGKNVTLNAACLGDCDLIEIGDNTTIGAGACVIGHVVEKNKLIMREVKIGAGCDVGLKSSIMPGVVMEDRSILGAHSLALKGAHLDAGGIYGGSPAALVAHRDRPRLKAVEGGAASEGEADKRRAQA